MAATDWLPWVNFILIIILIIIIVVVLFFGTSGIVRGVNYKIQDLSGSDTSVNVNTGDNIMAIINSSIQQTAVVLANSSNRKGLTFAIANTSDPANDFNITVTNSSNVSIDFGGAGDTIMGGETAFFIATNDNNSFLRYQ